MSESESRSPFDGSPTGMRRGDQDGLEIIDGLAGRASSLGFGNEAVFEAIQSVASHYLGDANQSGEATPDRDSSFAEVVYDAIGNSKYVTADSVHLCESSDTAVELAIRFARGCKPDAYRTVALIGSDHGRTAACRTASGRPELHQRYGPMLPGFSHVPPGDIDALRSVIDESVGCFLFSPIDLHDAATPLDSDYLQAVRSLCDETRVAMIADETRLCFGASGSPFTFASLADIRVDGAILSAGLFGGLPGGIFVGSESLTKSTDCFSNDYPLQRAIALATFSELSQIEVPDGELLQERAVALAEKIGSFEFIRDIHATGGTIGIVTDIRAEELIAKTLDSGLRIERSGETSVLMQLPLVVDDEDWQELLSRFGDALTKLEQETADSLTS